MLKSMFVKNFAIIDNIQIDFKDQMTVLTGETGAGKSLIIDAIGLLFGDRASSELVRRGETKATVEGVFDTSKEIENYLSENEIDQEEYLVVRRDIYENGKSVCKINGETVSLNQLSDLGLMLGSIHTQFDNEKLTNPKNYFDFIDTDLVKEKLIAYQSVLKEYNQKLKEYQKLLRNEAENNQKLDFLKYQLSELRKANLNVNEEEELKSKVNILNNFEKIQTNITSFLDLYENDEVLDKIYESISLLSKISEYDSNLGELKSSLEDSYYNLCDIVQSVKSNFKDSDTDLDELDQINDRLGLYSNLKRKYKMTTEELISYLESITTQIDSIENFDVIRGDLEKEVNKLKEELLKLANEISSERCSQAKSIEKEIKDNLVDLQLNNTILEIKVIKDEANFRKNGIDEVEINITFNVGEALKPLHKVASGGELSRFMLALKAIASKKFKNKTLIFDEIDSGVSGSVAYSIASKIKSIAKYAQVLCVTHLVQVASSANHQLFISKDVVDNRTITNIKELSMDERVIEISKMASFGDATSASIDFAKELLNQNK